MEMLNVSYIFPPNKMIDEIKENRSYNEGQHERRESKNRDRI